MGLPAPEPSQASHDPASGIQVEPPPESQQGHTSPSLVAASKPLLGPCHCQPRALSLPSSLSPFIFHPTQEDTNLTLGVQVKPIP